MNCLISGEIDGVETARARVRELTPLIFCFDLPLIPSLQNTPDNNDPYLRAIQDQYNIQVSNNSLIYRPEIRVGYRKCHNVSDVLLRVYESDSGYMDHWISPSACIHQVPP